MQQTRWIPNSPRCPIRWDNYTVLSSLHPSDLAPNLLVGTEVEVASDVELGANVVIHDRVTIREGARIDIGAVLGRISMLNRRSRSSPDEGAPTLIDVNATVCVYAVVTAGSQLGPHSLLGDLAHLREGARLGTDTVVGTACGIGRDVRIGDRTRMQNQCVVGPGALIEEDCFLGPGVQLLTGRTMNGSDRRPPPVLRRGCQIGAGAMVMSGVEVGEGAVVGAGAVVTADVDPGGKVMGMPARVMTPSLAEVRQLG